jgi:hypothetical protein
MKPELPFDFIVDKEKNTLIIRREFKANRQLVWSGWSNSGNSGRKDLSNWMSYYLP